MLQHIINDACIPLALEQKGMLVLKHMKQRSLAYLCFLYCHGEVCLSGIDLLPRLAAITKQLLIDNIYQRDRAIYGHEIERWCC